MGRRAPAGSAAHATLPSMGMHLRAGTRPVPAATCCCRSFTRSRTGSAGSASRPSTTSRSGSPCRRPRRTASRPSMPCTRPSRGRRSWRTSATTSRAGWPARSRCAPTWRESSARPGARPDDGRTTWLRSPCLGLCDLAPAALITTAGETARNVTAAPIDAAGIVSRLGAGTVGERPSPALPQPAERAAATATTGRRRRSRVGGRLSGAGRLSRPRSRARDRTGGGHRRDHRVGPGRARRRGLPHRSEVGRGRRAAGGAALRRLQRGRVGAGHVQGPGAARGRPVRRSSRR